MGSGWHPAFRHVDNGIEVSGQGSVKVAVCTICPSMLVAGLWLPVWANAVAWRRATMWEHRTTGKNRDFAGALGVRERPHVPAVVGWSMPRHAQMVAAQEVPRDGGRTQRGALCLGAPRLNIGTRASFKPGRALQSCYALCEPGPRRLAVAVKQVRVSDLSGRQADEEQFGKLIVHEHPQYQGPSRLMSCPRRLGSCPRASNTCPLRSFSRESAAGNGRCCRLTGLTSWPPAATCAPS
jgi:hypothetical protein